jgi:GT2 family glycosyltransferase
MHCRLAVGIPTVGRASILRDILLELTRQTRQPDSVIVCGTKPADVEGVSDVFPQAQVLLCDPGLPRQRNVILAAATGADIVVFFDDDFLPDVQYLEQVENQMELDGNIVLVTGLVLADGITGPGISTSEGRIVLARAGSLRDQVKTVFSGYGCNMAVRAATMRTNNILFDERLPLYGWQEDVDLSRRLAAFGRVVEVASARGIHLGVKLGRSSGVRLGYSQVANPLYLFRKKCGYPFSRALEHIARNMAMNLVHCPWPEPHVDRRGRLRGNILALRDLMLGQMIPERILEL